MKNIVVLIMLIGLALNAYSVEDRLTGASSYFESSEVNTSAKELPMSPYKNGTIVFFRKDTAYMFTPNQQLMIDKIIPCPELMGLGIEGTFAYDEKANKLYFSKKGETGGNDLFVATWNEKEKKWDAVEMLLIRGVMKQQKAYKNSSLAVARWVQTGRGASGFYNPSLSADGKKIYFSGAFKAGKGGRDIWYIEKESDAIWSRPQLISEADATASNEDYPLVIGDTLLYFASDREGSLGGLDIFYAKKGAKEHTWGKAEALSDVVNSSANDYNVAFGKINHSAFFISDRTEGHGDADIYSAVLLNIAPDFELTALPTMDEPKGFNWILFFFDLDKYDMKPEYEIQLDELIAAMAEYPGAKFEISGHTDVRGEDDYNTKLSDKRARFVRELLIKRGVDPSSLVAVGRGKTEPIIKDAQTEPEHEQNRRVEVRIIEEDVNE